MPQSSQDKEFCQKKKKYCLKEEQRLVFFTGIFLDVSETLTKNDDAQQISNISNRYLGLM